MFSEYVWNTYEEIMANPSASASTSVTAETMLLDIDKMTPEKWRALIYNKIVKQKDIFINDFKNTIVNFIEECMKNIKPDMTFECVQKDLLMKIKENKFELEYHKFIDSIVGVTFEYFCQLIITNSFDNIKRTQNALSCFAVPNNINAAETGSNDNATGTGEVNLSQLFNNTSLSNTTSILMNEHTSKINNLALPVGLSGINLANNYIHTAQRSLNNEEEEEELKSDSSILSIAMNINEEDLNMKFADDFENDDINNEIQPSKLEEEYQIKTSLKLLENLVNIEHNKLEVQKTLADNELPQSNICLDEKKQGKILNKPNFRRNMRSLETLDLNTNGELLPQDTELKKNDHIKQNKSKRKNSRQNITMRKKSKRSKDQKNLNNTLQSELSTELQIDKICSVNNTNSESTKPTCTNIKATVNSKETLSNIEPKEHSCYVENISVSKKETSVVNNNSNGLPTKTNPVASTSTYNEVDGDLLNKSSSSSSLAKTTQDYKKIYEKDRKSLFNPDIIVSSKPTKKENLIKMDKHIQSSAQTDKSMTTKKSKITDNRIIVRITSITKKSINSKDTLPNSITSSSKQKLPGQIVKHYKIKKPKKNKSHSKKVKANANTNNEIEKLNTTEILKEEELNTSIDSLKSQESGNEQVLVKQEFINKQLSEKQILIEEQLSLENQELNTSIDTLKSQESNNRQVLENQELNNKKQSEKQILIDEQLLLDNQELNPSINTLKSQESDNRQVLENQELNNKQLSEKQILIDEQLLLKNQVVNTVSSENNSMPEWIKKLTEYYEIKPCYIVIERDKRY